MAPLDLLLLGAGSAAARTAQNLGARFVDLLGGDFEQAFGRAAEAEPDLIVYTGCWDGALQPRPLESLSDEDWREGVDRPLETLLNALHVLGRRYPQAPPPIVMLGPSLALSGAEELVMLCAAAEGQRALMKSAARQWGLRGFRFTWVTVDPVLYASELSAATLPKSQDPDPLALDGGGGLPELARLLSWLADGRAAVVTGQTLALDGGELMLP